MKIAITGSSGLLGSSFISFFSKKNENFFTVNRKNYIPEVSIDQVVNYFQSENTSIIIHCAANTDVELCEKNQKQCFHDNYQLTEVLTKVSKKLNIKLIFISSTGVYGDYKSSPYIETDTPNPKTVYHKSKLDSETMIQNNLKNYIIIRTGWLFGGNPKSPKNFVLNRLLEAKNSDGKIFSNIDQKGNPTYTNDIVKVIYNLIQFNKTGLFNCVNEGVASRYEYVSEIIKIANYPTKVERVKKSAFNRKANVSNNEMAINANLDSIGFNKMPNWRLSLKDYMSSLEI